MTDDQYFAFVRESNKIEGITREPTMQEVKMTKSFVALPKIGILHLVDLVDTYQPGNVLRDSPNLNVRVGSFVAPRGGPSLVKELEVLLDLANAREGRPWSTPYVLHCRYETLHPFTDGNGRSGRALWLWSMRGAAPLGFLHHFYYQTLQHFHG